MDYYYSDGQNQFGPVTLENLRTKIDANTLVWHDGMPNWDKASNIEELKAMFAHPTPPSPPEVVPLQKPKEAVVTNVQQQNVTLVKKCDKTLLILSIFGIIASLLCIIIGFSIFSHYSAPQYVYVKETIPVILFSGLYLLVFSIIALAKASKKK